MVVLKDDLIWFSVYQKTEQNYSKALTRLQQLLVFILLVNMKSPEWWSTDSSLIGIFTTTTNVRKEANDSFYMFSYLWTHNIRQDTTWMNKKGHLLYNNLSFVSFYWINKFNISYNICLRYNNTAWKAF